MQSEACPPARVLIADDHALVREGMRTMLAREPDLEVVGEARNGREALEFCRSSPPDLVLMDLRMPEMDGLTATRAIKGEYPTTSVLIITTHENLDYLLEAIKAGAAGYVLKDASKQQLMSAVRGVLDGESPLNQELAMRLIQRLAFDEADQQARPPLSESSNKEHQQQEPPPESPLERLTTRELETLRLLAQGKTNREVARELHLSPSTIKAHVGRLIAKLGVSDRTQAAVRAVELGLLSKQEEEQEAEPAPNYPAELTAREIEVLRLVAGGLTNAQVAERLFLSPRTVNAHLNSIYGKLEVGSRGAAVRFAVERGLV